MSNHLYINPKGFAVTRHSYSAGQDFRLCRRKYQLNRIKGWKEKKRNAALEFGNCVEAAIQYYHANALVAGSGVYEFKRLWAKWEQTELNYSAKEGDWADMLTMGAEMLALYEILLPTFGYFEPKFQLNYRKEVFPGTELAGLEYTSFIDMHAKVQVADETLCPPQAPIFMHKPIIIDIKTASKPIDVAPNLLSLDPQLREYAWVTGVSDVAFLNLVKARPDAYKKGDRVTILLKSSPFEPGTQALVAKNDDLIGLIPTAAEEDFDKIKGQSKAAGEQRFTFIQERGAWVSRGAVTKQRIQFLTAHISEENIREAGEVIGQEIAEIVAADRKGSFPKNPGLRFPNDHCLLCHLLPICVGDDKKRDETLVQIGSSQERTAQSIQAPPQTSDLLATPRDWVDELENS